MTSPTVEAEDSGAEVFGTPVSDLQTDLAVADGAITGTLRFLDSGAIADYWGEGYFMALKFSDIDARATSVRVGMDPSEGSGLVEIIDDPDKNGVFKVTDKDTQVFEVVTTDGNETKIDTYDLTGLTIEE